MRTPDPLSFALGAFVGAGAALGMGLLLTGDDALPRPDAAVLQPPAAQPMRAGDRAFTPTDATRGRRAAPGPDEQADPEPEPAEGTATTQRSPPSDRKLPYGQMTEAELLETFAAAVRVREMDRAAHAVRELKKRFPRTEIPYAVIRPEMERRKAHHGIVNAAIGTWHLDTVVAALERAAAASGAPRTFGEWRFTGSVANVAARYRGKIPRWLVTRLVDHPDLAVHWPGLLMAKIGHDVEPAAVTRRLSDVNARVRGLAALVWAGLGRRPGNPVPEAKLRSLAAGDPAPQVQIAAIRALSTIARAGFATFPEDLVNDALESGRDPQLRARAIEILAQHLVDGTEMERERAIDLILVAAREDEHAEVREIAISNLEYLGAPGAALAVELLDTPGFLASDNVDSAVWAAVAGGRASDVLSRRGSAHVATLALDAVRTFGEDEERPHLLRDLASSLESLLGWRRLYTDSGAAEVAANLIETLVEQGVTDPVLRVATNSTVPVEVRFRALHEMLRRKETHATAFPVATALLRDGWSPAALRTCVIEDFQNAIGDDVGDPAALREEIERTAEHDPSFYVQQRAKRALTDLDD